MASSYLITGGAGFLGINLCRYLLERGARVRSLDIAPFEYPERSRVEVIDGDVRDRAAVERAMSGVDVVVHAAAALPLAAPAEIFSTTVQGTELLLQAAMAEEHAWPGRRPCARRPAHCRQAYCAGLQPR
jgi:nucleoside-diphosphate-sugar epimerase